MRYPRNLVLCDGRESSEVLSQRTGHCVRPVTVSHFHSLLFQHCVAVLLPLLGRCIVSTSGGAALGDLALECLDYWSVRTSKCEGTHRPSFRDPRFEVGQDLGVVSLKKGKFFLQKSRVFLAAKWCAKGRCKLLAKRLHLSASLVLMYT